MRSPLISVSAAAFRFDLDRAMWIGRRGVRALNGLRGRIAAECYSCIDVTIKALLQAVWVTPMPRAPTVPFRHGEIESAHGAGSAPQPGDFQFPASSQCS